MKTQFLKTAALNPATLLPDDDPQAPLHHCVQHLEQVTGLRPDLKDEPWPNPDAVLFTNGSSFVSDGVRYAGAAVVTVRNVIWAQALSHGTSAQRAELIALTQALRWGKDKTVNIYTDSRYAFATAHVHGALYKERGLLTSGGKKIKNKEQILALLEAIWLPKKVAIIHCPGHQKGEGAVEKGNRLADKTAKEVARKPVGTNVIIGTLLVPPLVQAPNYSPQDIELGKQLHEKFEHGWLWIPDGRPVLPAALGNTLISQMHNATHLGGTKLIELQQLLGALIMPTKDIDLDSLIDPPGILLNLS
ncbi:uncharacterized protein LOC111735726 [Pteropus vampyrus]|uniref:Uncharacterized protein LOC111735726 n=1 Tax=Pteropus vampyrus TaxID=132908 RepID=A0A6P6C730_PTEVA|nr:uncharacterized protein LOC111735726 [Pteropus vampyrus]